MTPEGAKAPFSRTTHDITVSVRPLYLETESNLFSRKFVFAYFIRIENRGDRTVQLLRRHWLITHDTGKVEEVEGEGVIGKQPFISPGQFHEYNSFCILESMEGFMEGTYTMQRSGGERFEVEIPRFFLKAMSN
ncbi:MAG: Co2+/Mg2+ efflux protein ApaG [Bacteroidetes bacterium]|nr:MAG: Co2+/Mg2+ efflux protein ApaG [Bacteroidota bacterium]